MAPTVSAGTTSHAGAGIASAALGGNVAGNVDLVGVGAADVAVISPLLVVEVSGVAEHATVQAKTNVNAVQLRPNLISEL